MLAQRRLLLSGRPWAGFASEEEKTKPKAAAPHPQLDTGLQKVKTVHRGGHGIS